MEFQKKRFPLIFYIALVSMILITSQSNSAFAGFVDEDNDGFQNLYRECNESDTNCDPDDGDPCNPNPYSESCIPSENIIEIKTDVNGEVVVGSDDVVVISNDATVNGNIDVNGGTLIVGEDVTINGNIESTGGTVIIENGSTLNGNIQIKVSGAEGILTINDASIMGNIESVGIDTLTVTNIFLGGNISSTNDKTVKITDNTVNGNMDIISPTSCLEGNNTVNGNNSGCT